MEMKMEVTMKDGTVKHENVKVKNFIEAHQKMHKKYKGLYNTTLVISE